MALMKIDVAILEDITGELVDKKNPEEAMKLYDFLQTNNSDFEVLASYLGISTEELYVMHQKKLSECLDHLKELAQQPGIAASSMPANAPMAPVQENLAPMGSLMTTTPASNPVPVPTPPSPALPVDSSANPDLIGTNPVIMQSAPVPPPTPIPEERSF